MLQKGAYIPFAHIVSTDFVNDLHTFVGKIQIQSWQRITTGLSLRIQRLTYSFAYEILSYLNQCSQYLSHQSSIGTFPKPSRKPLLTVPTLPILFFYIKSAQTYICDRPQKKNYATSDRQHTRKIRQAGRGWGT